MPTLNVRCCTWNVGDEEPPEDDLRNLLGLGDSNLPDIISVSLQETINLESWRKRFIEHVHPLGYVLIKSRKCWSISIFLFVRRNLLPAITNIESEVTACGYAGVMGNKGGVSARFEICGVNIIFLSCHFAAHKHQVRDRLNDFMDIINNQTFRDEDVHSILDHDYVFWMGDLNFRLELDNKHRVERLIKEERYEDLLDHDQLLIHKDKGLIFVDFLEGPIKFAPTFKFDKMTDIYDSSSKQRIPAWTDRILYMTHRDFATDYCAAAQTNPNVSVCTSRYLPVRGGPSEVEKRLPSSRRISLGMHQPDIRLLQYTSLPEYKSSDHRPVVGSFDISIPPRWFSLPISFIEPMDKAYPVSRDLNIVYTVLNPPALLQMNESTDMLTTKPNVPTVGFIQLMLLSAMGRANEALKNEGRGSVSDIPLSDSNLEHGRWDWVGVYPADFADLQSDYVIYVYAPRNPEPSEGQGLHALVKSSNTQSMPQYRTKISASDLAKLRNQHVQLLFWSKSKNCPQGYSPKILMK